MLQIAISGRIDENVTDPLYQYDVGQKLQISGTGLTIPPKIHFTNLKMSEALAVSATMENDIITVDIPNSLLAEPHIIYAYVYLVEDETGQTVHLVKIPIIKRQKPTDYEPLEDEALINYERLDARLTALIEEWTGAFDDTQDALQALTIKVNGVTAGAVSLGMGMYACTTVFNEDGSITETGDGWEKQTVFNADGSITESYTSEENGETKTITKLTTFNADGSITATLVN